MMLYLGSTNIIKYSCASALSPGNILIEFNDCKILFSSFKKYISFVNNYKNPGHIAFKTVTSILRLKPL